MIILITIYIILVSFAFTSTLGLVGDTDIFNTKYYVLLITMFALLIVTPILNIIPIVIYILVLIRQKD